MYRSATKHIEKTEPTTILEVDTAGMRYK